MATLPAAATAVTMTEANAYASTTAPRKVAGTVALVPAQGALLGHYYGNGTIAQTDKRIGRKPAVHLTYYDFKSDDWVKSSVSTSDFADGRIPLVNVEPNDVNFHRHRQRQI
jgi:hypothetical protein